jgi:hypothetical protein
LKKNSHGKTQKARRWTVDNSTIAGLRHQESVVQAQLRCKKEEIDRLAAENAELKDRLRVENDDTGHENIALKAEVERLAKALQAINEIRNSIVGTHTVNWAAHVYPLVKVLNEVGIEGQGYEEARDKACTLIQQRDEALTDCRTMADWIIKIKTTEEIYQTARKYVEERK